MELSIIIADDHPLILKGLRDFLTEKGYTVTGSAKDGIEAFDLIVKYEPDIAILDIRMPLMTGLEVAKSAKAKNLKQKLSLLPSKKA